MKIDIEKFKNIPFVKRTTCVICDEKVGKPLIELPDFPMTEIYTTEKVDEKVGFADQVFHVCKKCGHAQIANVIDINLQYGSAISYHFRTSESATGRESSYFFADFLNNVTKGRHFNTIVEIGCNDLYLLKLLKPNGNKLIGIDPILKCEEKEFSEQNITVIGDFFENVVLNEKIDLVICKDTLEHVSNPKQFVQKIVNRSHNETLFFFQFPFLETLLAGCRFDQMFHQHLNYCSLKSIIYMLNEMGCELLDYKINLNHWGAILIAFKKGKNKSRYSEDVMEISNSKILERYKVFKSNMQATNKRLSFLKGETIYGYGAALMLPILSYHLKNDLSCLKCVIDDDKRKEGLYYINLPVSIRTREDIRDIKDSIVLITAIASMNNARRILPKLFELNPKQIIVPLNTI